MTIILTFLTLNSHRLRPRLYHAEAIAAHLRSPLWFLSNIVVEVAFFISVKAFAPFLLHAVDVEPLIVHHANFVVGAEVGHLSAVACCVEAQHPVGTVEAQPSEDGGGYVYLRDLSRTMNTQGRKLKETRASLEQDLARLAALKKEAEDIRTARTQELSDLRAEEERSDRLIANLQKDKNRYQKELETKRKQVEALNREIERIIAQAIEDARKKEEAARNSNKKSTARDSRPLDVKLSGEFAANKGKLPWPADGPVVETFGKHNHPVYTQLVMPANNGVNIGLSADAEVKAVFDGEVKRVIVMPGYGRCVLVQHGTYFTFYCKLGDVQVKSGDDVKTGQVLGRIDTIDGQTQLHFEVWKEKDPENPELWLRKK